jgi:hypothetical protein
MLPFFHNLIVTKVGLLFFNECTTIQYLSEVLFLNLSHFTHPKVFDPVCVTILSFFEIVLFLRRAD